MSGAEDEVPWPESRVTALRELWADPGMSAGAIGKVLKCSKNAVVSKAFRIGLPRRDSPIKPAAPGAVVKTAAQLERDAAGLAPLPAFHPIAMAVLADGAALARLRGVG